LRKDAGFLSDRNALCEALPVPAVVSSAIEDIRYSDRRRELYVTFVGRGPYTYYEVPREVYDDFMTAPSKGQFFNEQIRDRYRFDRSPGRDWAIRSE
jgi:lysyl-tRNA synthetase, class II